MPAPSARVQNVDIFLSFLRLPQAMISEVHLSIRFHLNQVRFSLWSYFPSLVRPATSPIKKGGMNQTLLGEHVHRCLHQPDWILLLCRWLSALLLPSLSDHPDWDQRWKSYALQGVQACGYRVLRRLARWKQSQIFSFFFCLGTTQHVVYPLMTYIQSHSILLCISIPLCLCLCVPIPRKRI